MAIAYVREKDGSGYSTTLTLTSVQVEAGQTLVVAVFTYAASSSDPISDVTFNTTESLTKIVNANNSTGDRVTGSLWQLAAPTATTADIVISSVSGFVNMYATAMVYSGAKTSGVMTNSNSNTGTSNSQSVALTGTAATSWAIGGVDTDNKTPSGSATFTVRTINAIPPAGDSNGVTGGGTYTMNASTDSGTQHWIFVGAELLVAPAPSGPANVKTKDGVTQSTGIKTYEGVALASVKTVEGVA